jgi:small subunit ribosomal protein S18
LNQEIIVIAKRKIRKLPPVKTDDPFVKAGKLPSYKRTEELLPFLSDRGKVLPKSRTGLTAKTQRILTIAVKRARHLAMLPFLSASK